jgi:hypothetical protein
VTISVNLTETQIFTALQAFLLNILPAGIEVVRGQDNRVAEPVGSDFVVMTPLLRERLSTNVNSYVDAVFTGSISGTTLTITAVQQGVLALGNQIFGVGIVAGTMIISQTSGTPGGIGVYVVSNAQTIGSETIAAGIMQSLMPIKFTAQIDVHGPASADNAQIISTLYRDDYAVQQFASSGFDVVPLYMGEPRQIPYLNGEQQIEERWSIDTVMQCNPIVTTPQDFAAALSVVLNEVP